MIEVLLPGHPVFSGFVKEKCMALPGALTTKTVLRLKRVGDCFWNYTEGIRTEQ